MRNPVRKQLRAAREFAAWVGNNPGQLRDMARGLLAASPNGGEQSEVEVPDTVAQHQRSLRAVAASSASPARVVEIVSDLSLLSSWLKLHASFRGEDPKGAAVGSRFVEQVKIMGIPAEVAWEVVRLDETGLTLEGAGPMGLVLLMHFTVHGSKAGSEIVLDCGLSGDPVSGPMGGTVSRNVQQALDGSLAALAELAASDVDTAEPTAPPVRHLASGELLDPRTPVIVGVGQVVQRVPDVDKDPAHLAGANAVTAVASTSWTYNDLGAAVAAQVGARPSETVQSARFGGDGGQALVNAAGKAIAQGEHDVVLVCGAEAGASLAAAQKQGLVVAWPVQDDGVQPTRVLGSEREANSQAEGAAGLGAPVYMYALIEDALRAKMGESVVEHKQRIAALWSRFSKVAAGNASAWQPEAFSADHLATPTEQNREVSSPYSKLLCANLQVDLASGIILTSVGSAEAAGIDQDRWVFLHAGAAANDEWFVSERGDLAASPAIRTLGRQALDRVGRGIDDIDHIDLYACFPAAVQIAANELGLPIDDPNRPLTVTGGLTFAGGPGNNYGGHAIATMVQRLRQDPGSYGLTTSLGWYLTKHALGIYSTTPPVRPYEALEPVLPLEPSRSVLTDHEGSAIVEASTVQFARSGEPEAVIVSAVTPEGDRVVLRSTQPEIVTELHDKDPHGWTVQVGPGSSLSVESRSQDEIPPCPTLPVLVEDRGAVRIITINRPHRRNAIDHATAELLERVIDGFEADGGVRVAVITGADDTFCAGMDLKAAAQGSVALTEKRGPLGIAALPISKPVIAAVEGHALAGGCELALVADLIVAADDSAFGLPESKRGLVAAAGGVLRLSQRLPRNLVLEMTYTGDPVSAHRLHDLGLVNRLAKPGKTLETAIDLAERIALNAPLSIEVSKEIVDQCGDWTRDEEFQRQTDLAGRALFSLDAAEGIAAFAEHREPGWQGR